VTLPTLALAVVELLQRAWGAQVPGLRALTPVHGGSINRAFRCELEDGRALFIKHHPQPPMGFFAAEAAGLAALARADCLRIPEVIARRDLAPALLVLEWLEVGREEASFGERLGRGLASLHRQTARRYGFDADNYLGSTLQTNTPLGRWSEFFGERRLRPLWRRLRAKGAYSAALEPRFEGLLGRLEGLLELPEERPALVHGDLWSGNWLALSSGEAALVDPAVSYGCREADLAMMELFGAPPAGCFEAYRAEYPLCEGYVDRRDLYNLYHLMNHALMFGGGYVTSTRRCIERFA
jgi:protein-ribulosamine 3-kinase